MTLAAINTTNLRYLSQIFTTATFKRVVRNNDTKLIDKKIKKFYPYTDSALKYKTVLSSIYNNLEAQYRSEYFFKNSLFHKYLLNQYSLATTAVFNEFKVGNSIADFVLLNGTARVFEIKTDLDKLDKLDKQLEDYKKFADLVYIVTTPKHSKKLLSDYSNSSIGILEFSDNNIFKELKKATSNSKHFEYSTLFKTLRKSEYLEIVEDKLGYIPEMPNTKVFRKSFEILSTIDLIEFQKLVFNKLKKRKIQCPELLQSKKTPSELKQICYTLNFSAPEYENLFNFLQKKV